MGVVKSAWNCINIYSDCKFMQFWSTGFQRESRALSDGRRKYFQSKIRYWWIEYISNWNRKIWNCILMFVALHHDGCYFALQKLQLCFLMVASLHGFLQWSFWKPNLQHFSSSYWMSYILPPRILHSLRKPTTFLTRIHFIPYENTLHSRKEWSVFSYRA